MLCAALTGCGTTSSGAADPPPASPTAASTHPSAHTAAAAAHDHLAASAIVGDPHARVDAFSVIPGRHERRITEWHTCSGAACSHWRTALTVTRDGFAHAHVVELPVRASSWFLEPAGPHHFAVALNGGRRQLVDLSGHVTQITVSGARGPLTGADVALRAAIRGYLAVDPATGAAHPLTTPPGTQQLEVQPSGQLRVLAPTEYAWSDDGGATWHPIPLPPEGQPVTGIVPSASDDVHAVLEGGDGATLFPWDRILKSTDGVSWTPYPGPSTPEAYVDSPVAMPDGRLLINVVVWSDQRAGKPAPRPVGFYAGSDWSAPASVGMGAPFDVSPDRSMVNVLDLAVTPRSVTVYAHTPDQTGVVASTDGGATWQPVTAR
jgi:hypothetical protein